MRQPRSGTRMAIATSAVAGTTSTVIDARVADQDAVVAPGPLIRNVQEPRSSLGTKNEARRPMTIEYARTSGIHRTAVRGCASDAKPRAPLANPAITTDAPSAVLIAIRSCCAPHRASVSRMKSAVACATGSPAVIKRAKARPTRTGANAPTEGDGASACWLWRLKPATDTRTAPARAVVVASTARPARAASSG